MLAVRDLLYRRPDLVISGINNGPNMGDDVTYSGTVAGAYEGMLLGLPAIAVSCVSHAPRHVETAAQFAKTIARFVLDNGLPDDTVLNVNVPDIPMGEIQGVEFTRMGRRTYEDEIIERRDPRGNAYYWIGGDSPSHVHAAGTDFEAIDARKISVTPLHRDITNVEALARLRKQELSIGVS
jgi:5'-nucleotidase